MKTKSRMDRQTYIQYIKTQVKLNAPNALTKDYKIGICCFSAKHAALRRKRKYWLARYQDNVFKWGKMSIHRLLLL